MTIRVFGTPAPKGSKSFKGMSKRGHAILVESSKRVKPWAEAVKWAALEHRCVTIDAAVTIDLTFYLPRPKTLPKRVIHCTKKPDLDKLQRSTFDALKEAGVYRDDSQVVSVNAAKVYATEEAPGALIAITQIVGVR